MIEIKYTETKNIKLTITPSKVTLKFPIGSTGEIVHEYLNYTIQIVGKFKPINSYRGVFRIHEFSGELGISMKANSGDPIYFKF
jgi:hypothetical protein